MRARHHTHNSPPTQNMSQMYLEYMRHTFPSHMLSIVTKLVADQPVHVNNLKPRMREMPDRCSNTLEMLSGAPRGKPTKTRPAIPDTSRDAVSTNTNN